MKVQRKPDLPIYRDASQWHKNGDHPLDGPADHEGKVVRYYRNPQVPGDKICGLCGRPFDEHGFIDNQNFPNYLVCPGSWIINSPGGYYVAMNPEQFAKTYEAV